MVCVCVNGGGGGGGGRLIFCYLTSKSSTASASKVDCSICSSFSLVNDSEFSETVGFEIGNAQKGFKVV